MARTHIHFIGKQPSEQVQSGFRSDSNFCIFININAAIHDGIKFYRSANDVILTRGSGGLLSPKYFTKAVRIATGEEVWSKGDGLNIPEASLVKTEQQQPKRQDTRRDDRSG